MSYQIPTIEPSSATAGDSISWTRTLPDYPASAGWVLSYALLSSAGKITITGTASGSDHLISVSAATSSAWTAGTYAWQSYVTNGSERHLVSAGTIEIKANFAAVLAATDTRGHAQRVLDAIEAVLEGTATTDQRRTKIGDKEIDRHTVGDLLKLRDYYKTEALRDAAAEKINQGLRPGNKILTRF